MCWSSLPTIWFYLRSFIRLADYLIVNTMHVLAVNSVSTLLNYLSEQLQNTPTLEDIQGWNTAAMEALEKKDEEKEKDEDTKVKYRMYNMSIKHSHRPF